MSVPWVQKLGGNLNEWDAREHFEFSLEMGLATGICCWNTREVALFSVATLLLLEDAWQSNVTYVRFRVDASSIRCQD